MAKNLYAGKAGTFQTQTRVLPRGEGIKLGARVGMGRIGFGPGRRYGVGAGGALVVAEGVFVSETGATGGALPAIDDREGLIIRSGAGRLDEVVFGAGAGAGAADAPAGFGGAGCTDERRMDRFA